MLVQNKEADHAPGYPNIARQRVDDGFEEGRELVAAEFALADAVCDGLLRDRIDGDGLLAL
jgi:hypothetical protein